MALLMERQLAEAHVCAAERQLNRAQQPHAEEVKSAMQAYKIGWIRSSQRWRRHSTLICSRSRHLTCVRVIFEGSTRS